MADAMMPALQIPEVTGPILTTDWAIEGVHGQHAAIPWRRCWELLHKAVRRYAGPDAWTSESLMVAVQKGECQLWIAWSYQARKIEGAVITRIVENPAIAPDETVLEGVLVGGEGMEEWGPGMMGLLKAWGRDQGCSYIGGPGRQGWMRAFGFREVGKTEQGQPILAMPIARAH